MISLVLSGGVGSRLWPFSRAKLPKQFSPLFTESLFDQTVKRLAKMGGVRVCTSEALRTLTEKSIRTHQLPVEDVIYEPVGRNTAPAIAVVCKRLEQQGLTSEIMGVFPSDHWIQKVDVFQNALKLAEQCAEQGQIVTIGIKPDHPATGFGYIEVRDQLFLASDGLEAFQVEGFREKPPVEVAEQYLKGGKHFWNSGMFVFKVSVMIEALQKHMPDLWDGLSNLKADMSNLEEVYAKLPSQSIDYGIMEKVSEQVNIPCDIGWSDLGSWDDVATTPAPLRDETKVFNNQAQNNFAISDRPKTICFSNVDDLVVVDTDDALLITKKDETQSVKQVVESLQKENPLITTDHEFEHRPWGFYRNLYEQSDFKTKVITVDPGQQLSYQSHTKRSEIWVVVSGKGEVILDDEAIPVYPGKVVSVPVGAKHRMRNGGDTALQFVEVQLGEYFGEDDITRYEDDYNRK